MPDQSDRGRREAGSEAGPARLFALGAGILLSLLGVLGFFYDAGFDTGKQLAADDVAGIIVVNGWRNVIYLLSGLLALGFAPRRPRRTAAALAVFYLVTRPHDAATAVQNAFSAVWGAGVAVVDFFVRHSNITGGVAFHTWAGVLLRPFDHLPDSEMNAEDLWHYRRIGDKGTELTGYPAISVYEEFRYHPKEVIGGVFDWVYEHLGMYSWVVELWSPMREAGITNYKYIDWFRDHPVSDDLKLYRWNVDKLGGLAHLSWKPFDHPQLGHIEIGGWNRFHAFGNPPLTLLEREVERFPKWLLWQALTSPKMEILAAGAEALGSGHWRVRLVVQNTGWLPSYVSKRALERKVVRGVIAEIALPAGAELVQGKRREELGQLEGKAYKHTGVSFWPDRNVTDDRAKIEWIVSGKAGDEVRLIARHERAGTVRVSVKLG